MKLFVVLFAAISMCSGAAIPTLPRDNSHYVEGESRYTWKQDGDGVPHLVNLEAQADEAPLSGKDGLDPAGPQWGGDAFSIKDGQYEQTIHTDGQRLDNIFVRIADRTRQDACSNDSNNNNQNSIFICVNT